MLGLAEEMHGDPKLLEKSRALRKQSFDAAVAIRDDRLKAKENHTRDEILRTLYQDLGEALTTEAIEIRSQYDMLIRGLSVRDVEGLFADVQAAFRKIPYRWMSDLVMKNLSFDLEAASPSSKKFEGHESDYYDNGHLWGAAYCDVFTCDYKTAGYLGNARVELGMHRQLSERALGGRKNLVSELRRQVSA